MSEDCLDSLERCSGCQHQRCRGMSEEMGIDVTSEGGPAGTIDGTGDCVVRGWGDPGWVGDRPGWNDGASLEDQLQVVNFFVEV